MYSAKISLKSFILILSFILYSTNEVSALKCYRCASVVDGECDKDPKRSYNELDCNNWQQVPEFPDTKFSIFTRAVQSAISSIAGSRQLNDADYECLKITGQLGNERAVARMCTPKILNCDVWKSKMLSSANMVVDHCHNCQGDLCNSSQNVSVGFLSLIGSLLTILLIRI